MSDQQFRDAIAAAVHLPGISEANETRVQADAVLAMPEMQAIRDELWGYAITLQQEFGVNQSTEDFILGMELPPAVIAWVLDRARGDA